MRSALSCRKIEYQQKNKPLKFIVPIVGEQMTLADTVHGFGHENNIRNLVTDREAYSMTKAILLMQ